MQYWKEKNEFDTWDPVAYLREYFPRDVDNEPIVKFISEEGRRRLKPATLAIDIGCGPTVCYWSALAFYIQELHLADYLDSNLEQVRLWLNSEETAYDWTYYTEMILGFEGTPHPSRQDTFMREDLSRGRIKKIMRCDISKLDPIGASGRHSYDCVLSVCCGDSITHDKTQWQDYMQNIFSLLKPRGVFIGAAMRNCTHYKVGSIAYPSANINEGDFRTLLTACTFKDVTIRIADESHPILDFKSNRRKDLRPEYDQIILVAGTLEEQNDDIN